MANVTAPDAAAKFPPGTTVCLNSGGPEMTVDYYKPSSPKGRPEYRCQWFNVAGTTYSTVEDFFPEEMLTLVKPVRGG